MLPTIVMLKHFLFNYIAWHYVNIHMIYVHNPHPRSNVPGHQGCTFSHLLISVPSCRRPKLSRVGTTFSAITDRWVTSNLGRPTCPISSLIIKTPTCTCKTPGRRFRQKCILQDE